MGVLFTVTGGQGFTGTALSLELLDGFVYVTFFNFAGVPVLIGLHLRPASKVVGQRGVRSCQVQEEVFNSIYIYYLLKAYYGVLK
jgi:hypothetical protein